MPQIKPRTLQGFYDYHGDEMALRRFVEDKIRSVFIKYGYDEINTPSIEHADILFGKYGEEEKLIYHFNDHGDRHVALRYDQTVPLARFVAEHQNKLTFPFKRFEIGRVWRADAARKARKREFMQCDVDIIGDDSVLSDVEILLVVNDVFKALNLDGCKIHISDRRLLSSFFNSLNLSAEQLSEITRSIDKYDKIGKQGVFDEIDGRLKDSSIDISAINSLVEKLFKLQGKSFDDIKKELKNIDTEVLEKIEGLLFSLKSSGLKEGSDFIFDLTLVRGLDYYTGMVFEVQNKDFGGSFAGGGRYDDLCSLYANRKYSGVGVGIGFEPVCAHIMKEGIGSKLNNKILVTIFNKECSSKSLELSSKLRSEGFSVELYTDNSQKIGKQLKYADSKNIKHVIIIGESEIESNTFMLKNLKSGDQKALNYDKLVSKLSNL